MKPATAPPKSSRDELISGRRSFMDKLNPSFLKKAKDGDSLKLVRDEPRPTKKKKKEKSSTPKKTPGSDDEEDEINVDDEQQDEDEESSESEEKEEVAVTILSQKKPKNLEKYYEMQREAE